MYLGQSQREEGKEKETEKEYGPYPWSSFTFHSVSWESPDAEELFATQERKPAERRKKSLRRKSRHAQLYRFTQPLSRGKPALLESADYDARVVPTETETVRHHPANLNFTGFERNVIEVTLRIGRGEIDGWWYDAVTDRQKRENRL
jgi:hypothetical protein